MMPFHAILGQDKSTSEISRVSWEYIEVFKSHAETDLDKVNMPWVCCLLEKMEVVFSVVVFSNHSEISHLNLKICKAWFDEK